MTEEIRNPFTITSYTEGNPPIGVGLILPGTQSVFVDAPSHRWTAHKVGKTTYRLSVGGYPFVGVAGGRVFATILDQPGAQQIWKITRHKYQKAYTIELADRPGYGWTVGAAEGGGHRPLVIGPIVVGHSEPPHFLPGQLFLLEEPDE